MLLAATTQFIMVISSTDNNSAKKQLKSILKPVKHTPVISDTTQYHTYHKQWMLLRDNVLHQNQLSITDTQSLLKQVQLLNQNTVDELLEPLVDELIESIQDTLLAVKLAHGKPIQTAAELKREKQQYIQAQSIALHKQKKSKLVPHNDRLSKLQQIKQAIKQHRKKRPTRSNTSSAYNSDDETNESYHNNDINELDGINNENEYIINNNQSSSASKYSSTSNQKSRVRTSARKPIADPPTVNNTEIQIRSKRRKLAV